MISEISQYVQFDILFDTLCVYENLQIGFMNQVINQSKVDLKGKMFYKVQILLSLRYNS